jgi:hypothetical protein
MSSVVIYARPLAIRPQCEYQVLPVPHLYELTVSECAYRVRHLAGPSISRFDWLARSRRYWRSRNVRFPPPYYSASMNMDLMPSNSGSYYFFGGLLLLLGGILEFILGNTFPSVVFSSYGAFFLSFAATLQPFYYAYGLYAPVGQPESAGLDTVGFNSSFAFFLVFIAVLSFVFLILSIRTNVVFVIIFFTLVIFFGLLSGVYWQSANSIGNSDPSALALAHRLQVVGLIPFTIHYLCSNILLIQ